LVRLDRGRFRLLTLAALTVISLVLSCGSVARPAIHNSTPSTVAGPNVPVEASILWPNASKVSITPSAITGSLVASQISFGVNISKTFALSAFWVTLQYDNTVLSALGIDFTGGILGKSNPLVIYDCVNGQPSSLCPPSPSDSGADMVSLQLILLGSILYNASGLLFNINFQVIGVGLSNIHILRAQIVAVLASGTIPIPTSTFDGYFSNKQCGSTICRPLMLNLSHTPLPIAGRVVKFNATVVNPNGDAVQWYHWEWGDVPTVGTTDLFTRLSYANHTYLTPQNPYIVTLIVNDTYRVTGIVTIPIFVFPEFSPTILAPAAENGTTEHSLTFTVSAGDNDFDSVALAASGLPPGASFTVAGTNPANGTFTWTPPGGTGGELFNVTFSATDGHTPPVTAHTIIRIAFSPVRFLEGRLSWTHHLSLSKTADSQTWDAKIVNPNGVVTYAEIVITGTDDTGTSGFRTTSGVLSLLPGGTMTPTITQTFGPLDTGMKFFFIATILWGALPTSLTSMGGNTKTGSFTVVD
jgi:hypothetical protein